MYIIALLSIACNNRGDYISWNYSKTYSRIIGHEFAIAPACSGSKFGSFPKLREIFQPRNVAINYVL